MDYAPTGEVVACVGLGMRSTAVATADGTKGTDQTAISGGNRRRVDSATAIGRMDYQTIMHQL